MLLQQVIDARGNRLPHRGATRDPTNHNEDRPSPKERTQVADELEALRVQKQRKDLLSDEIEQNAPEFTNKYSSPVATDRQMCQVEITGGKLKMGNYHFYPSDQKSEHKPMANLYLSILEPVSLVRLLLQ